MGRWEPDARGRLEEAALELYLERGFEETTVADIAARAGLTERTFFRHFADKREVLFGGSARMLGVLQEALAATPAKMAPIEALAAAFEALGPIFDERRPRSRQRAILIARHPELQERELIKLASFVTTLAAELRRRGVRDTAASLAAESGVAAFKIAFAKWVEDAKDRAFVHHLRKVFEVMRFLVAPSPRS